MRAPGLHWIRRLPSLAALLLLGACGGGSGYGDSNNDTPQQPPSQGILPTIASFSASPSTITAGASATLTYSVTSATSLSIDNGVGTVSIASTQVTVQPSATTTYTLTATSPSGSVTRTTTVTVNPVSNPGVPVISAFSASPATIAAGGSTTLSWTVSNALSLSLNNGIGVVTGTSRAVSPTSTTTYTLTAMNANGGQTAQVTVTVNARMGSSATAVAVDRSTQYQTIEGFGFFGPKDVWWSSSDSAHFYDQAWLDTVIDDLGVTMWRNELYPNNPVESATASGGRQDATWSKQQAAVRALKAKADAARVPLKFLLTIWSPPGEWKVTANFASASDTNATRGGPHRADTGDSTKSGGTLAPAYYTDYANWLTQGLAMYRAAGVDVYALSLQNEPLFVEPYNSAVYTAQWYADLLEAVIPTVKSSFPEVKIFGAENMLAIESAQDSYRYFYHAALKSRPTALNLLDRWALHGYTDGVTATATAQHRDLWQRHYTEYQVPSGKPAWMTETSGYNDSWDTQQTDAFDLGIAIHAMLYYGKGAAWVYWYGTGDLIDGTTRTKRYYVSKQFFRYIRPGARMVALSTGDAEILGAAFEHPGLGNFVAVMINTAASPKTVQLTGDNIPQSFTAYRTSGTENAVDAGAMSKGSIVLAPKSVTTLVNGTVYE